MPSKYRKVPKTFTTAELRVAAAAIAPVAEACARHVATIAADRARTGVVGTRRGRGQRLSAYEKLAVFFYAVAIEERPREIARVLGMDHFTVRRLLATARYKRFVRFVDARVAESFAMRRHYIRARRMLV
jgi:hypothetical protein